MVETDRIGGRAAAFFAWLETESLDLLVVVMAGWTLACQLAVAQGGSLYRAMLYATIVVPGLVGLWRYLPRAYLPAVGTAAALPQASPRRLFGVAVVAALLFVLRPRTLLLWWVVAACTGFGVYRSFFRDPQSTFSPSRNRRQSRGLLALALLAVAYTLLAHRPDADDAFYLNVSVAASELPDQALYADDTIHGMPGLSCYLPIYRLHAYEPGVGAIGWLTGASAQSLYYFVAAPLFAFLAPLAWARLLRRVLPRSWFVTTSAWVVFLILIGETHRWHGNFGLVRIWQGKSILLSVMVPILLYLALDFGRQPGRRSAFLLLGAVVASVGFSSSALWLAPTLTAVGLCATVREGGWRPQVGILVFLAVAVLLRGWSLKGELAEVSERVAQSRPPGQLLARALDEVMGTGGLSVLLLLAVAVAWMATPEGLGRRLIAALTATIWWTLLNPYCSERVAAHVVGPSFWRVLWALPLPALLAILVSAPWTFRWRRGLLSSGLLGLFVLANVTQLGPSSENGVTLRLPGWKIDPDELEAAREVVRAGVPGTLVVAPRRVNSWIPTFRDRPYPLIVRSYYRGPAEEREAREELIELAWRPRFRSARQIGLARQELDRLRVTSFCFQPGNTKRDRRLRSMLGAAGFRIVRRLGDYEVWMRRLPAVPPAIAVAKRSKR